MKNRINTGIILLLFMLSNVETKAQESTNLFSASAEHNTFFSFTGLNISMMFVGNYKNHSIGIGVNSSLQNSYFPYQRTNGIIADYKYYFLKAKNMKGFASINYNNKNYSPLGRNVTKENKIHEYTYSNGFIARLYKGLWIGNSIGFGGYTERYYNASEQTYKTKSGFNYRLNAILKYDF